MGALTGRSRRANFAFATTGDAVYVIGGYHQSALGLEMWKLSMTPSQVPGGASTYDWSIINMHVAPSAAVDFMSISNLLSGVMVSAETNRRRTVVALSRLL